MKRKLITSALPYVNNIPHLGNLIQVLSADVFARFCRLRGYTSLYVCGTDEYGTATETKALEEGKTPRELCDYYHAIHRDIYHWFNIAFDYFGRTSTPQQTEIVQGIFKDIEKNGFIKEHSMEQLHCAQCNRFLADRYVRGTCPHCGYEDARGDQCEACGKLLEPTELKAPRCSTCGAAPEPRSTKHLYIDLPGIVPQYEPWMQKASVAGQWSNNAVQMTKGWLRDGLQERAITRDLKWGIPVPKAGFEDKVFYVWFDAPIGYISATKELTPDWEKFWKDEDTKLVHFIGKDNIVFHCIVFPTMLKAHGDYILPDNVPANEFMNLEGDKISTSGNWAVWLHEYLEEFPGQQDVLRYMLTANMPETKDNDFTWREFQSRNNSELVAVLGNFVNRALVLCQKYFGGKVPSPEVLLEEDRAVLEMVHAQRKLIEEAIESYHFRDALREYMQVARVGNKYLADTEPWKLWGANPSRVASIIYVSLQVTAALCVLGRPFLPFSTERLETMARLPKALWDDDLTGILKPGHELGTAELLFARIEDAAIERQIAKLQAAKQANEAKGNKPNFPPQKGLIDFETFEALDLRVGRILTAERVPKANKLLKFTVDTGIDRRTIVSGVAEHFAPEELVGKQVSVVMNLKPRVIRGVESQGMLIFAQDADGKLVVVAPNREVADGAGIG